MNRKIKFLTLLILIVLSSNSVIGQTTTENITTDFFKLYEKSPQKAVEYIFATNKWMMDRNKDGIEKVKIQLNNFVGLLGDYYGYEKIAEKSVGESYKLVSYMIKYDRQPIRFTFIFYKPKDKWQVQNFQFDDNLDEEIEEAGKVYRLRENWK